MKRFYSSIYFLLIGLAIAIFGFLTVQQYQLAKVAREKAIPNAKRLLELDAMLAEVQRIETETENYPTLVESGPTGDGYGIDQQFSYLSMMEIADDLPIFEGPLMRFTQYRQNQFPISYFSTAAVGKYAIQISVELQGKLPADQELLLWDSKQKEQRENVHLSIPVKAQIGYRLELRWQSKLDEVHFELTGSDDFEPLSFEVNQSLKLKTSTPRINYVNEDFLLKTPTATFLCEDGSTLIVYVMLNTDQDLGWRLWNSVEPESPVNPYFKILPSRTSSH